MLAAMARRSSVGWLGCSRTDSRPGRPMVSRKRVTTKHITIRSLRPLILATAAAISGVMPRASSASFCAVSASLERRLSWRNPHQQNQAHKNEGNLEPKVFVLIMNSPTAGFFDEVTALLGWAFLHAYPPFTSILQHAAVKAYGHPGLHALYFAYYAFDK